MTGKVRKPGSKLLGIGTFLLFFILKGASPKPAYAFVSSLDACAVKPECAAAISSEVAPAVAAPTGAGFGASTLTTTTATGASTSVNAVAGVTVVGDMRLSGIATYYLWNQAVNTRAQVLAKQRYCAAYPTDIVCPGQIPGIPYRITGDIYYEYPSCVIVGNYWRTVFKPWVHHIDSINNSGAYQPYGPVNAVDLKLTPHPEAGNTAGCTYDPKPAGKYEWRLIVSYGNPPNVQTWVSGGSWTRLGQPPKLINLQVFPRNDQPDKGKPWKDWPQEKRSTAVAALKDSDWQGLIASMPVGGRLNPGDKINAPTIVIPGQETDDSNTPADERILRKEPGFFNNPGGPDTDFDKDGSPDSADPEPQNPNVPTASSNPPSNDTPSEGEQAVDQVRESYDDFLDNPENASYRDRLDAIEEKYRQAAAMEEEAATDPDAGYEQDRLIGEADTEFRQLENEIGEAWWSSLSQYEQQLFDGRTQTEINEMQTLMKQWDRATYPGGVPESVLDHSSRKGYEDPLEYLRDASNFDKSNAERIPREGISDTGTVRWEIRNTGEYRIETPEGKTVTYGFNQY